MTKNLYFYSLLYLALPFILFNLFWLYTAIGFPIAFSICFILYKTYHRQIEIDLHLKRKDFLIILSIAVFLTIFSGIGGFVQQGGDLTAHNSKYYTLIKYNWPVKNLIGNENYLCYFLGFYLAPAYISKFLPHFFEETLIFWTFLGLFLGVSWFYVLFNKKYLYFFVVLSFGGVGQAINYFLKTNGIYKHEYFHSLLINSVFFELTIINQFIPSLIVVSIILYLKTTNRPIFQAFLPICFMAYWAIFPTSILVIIYCGDFVIEKMRNRKFIKFSEITKQILLFSLFIPLVIYLLGSGVKQNVIFIPSFIHNKTDFIRIYELILSEYLAIFVLYLTVTKFFSDKIGYNRAFDWLIIVATGIISTLSYGKNNDLFIRANMVLFMFYGMIICLYLSKYYSFKTLKIFPNIFLICYLGLQIYFMLEPMLKIGTPLLTGNYYGTNIKHIPYKYNEYPNIYQLFVHRYGQLDADQYIGNNPFIYKKLLK